MVNEPSGFEPLKFYCKFILFHTLQRTLICIFTDEQPSKLQLKYMYQKTTCDQYETKNSTNSGVTETTAGTPNLSRLQGMKTFSCDYCSRCFGFKSKLAEHLRTHTGERPFQCLQCHKRFALKHNLKAHMVTHYKDSLKLWYCHYHFTFTIFILIYASGTGTVAQW